MTMHARHNRFLASAAIASLLAFPGASFADGDIIIGHVAAATGELAPYDSVTGVQCMVDIVNDKGGVLGGRKLKLLSRDMKSDAALAGTAAQELIDAGAKVLFGPPTDDGLIPAGQIALPHSIPVLSVGSTQVQWPAAIPGIAYLTAYGDNASAASAAQFATKQGHKTALLMISHDVGSYSIATPRYFGETFEHLGGKILGELNWNLGTTDYSPQITEIAAMNPRPDMIFSAFVMPDGGAFMRQAQAAGLDIPVYGTDTFDDPAMLTAAGAGSALMNLGSHGFPSEGSTLKAFYDDCPARGYKIENVFFGLGGEAVEIVRHAIETAGSDEPAKINEAISNIENMKGITANSITFKGREGVPLKDVVIIQAKDGEFVLADRILPDWVPAGNSTWKPANAVE
jgi:branched-chain amino acid transport system substrate-binding protein